MPIHKSIIEKIQQNHPSLHGLDLRNNSLTDEDIKELYEALEKNTHLTQLNLANNPNIGDASAKLLAKLPHLKKN